MASQLFDFVIVGTGLTGLNLGLELQTKNPNAKIRLLEKSKSCGGRMATRRINEIKFDHGAQFIKFSASSKKLIEIWQNENLAKSFPSTIIEGICGQSGMTQLAKKIAGTLDVSYNFKASQLRRSSELWHITSDQGLAVVARQVILTSPLPQSIEILQNSGLSFDPALISLQYSRAIVLMVEAQTELGPEFNYQENVSTEIFSSCAQHAKGNSPSPAWTIVMSEPWSERHFELTDEQILESATKVISANFPSLRVESVHLKKWRFCQPKTTWKNPFESPYPGLYLAGDAFGGPSLLGALKSSYRLAYHLEFQDRLPNEPSDQGVPK